MHYKNQAIINLAALKHNIARVRHCAPNSKIVAMVKDDAYGHGLIPAMPALADADAYGIISLDVAEQLRQLGVKKPILLMPGFQSIDELKHIARLNVTPIVHQLEQVALLKSAKLEQSLDSWLKVDTGMHRLGLLPDEFDHAWQGLQQCSAVKQPQLDLCETSISDAERDVACSSSRMYNSIPEQRRTGYSKVMRRKTTFHTSSAVIMSHLACADDVDHPLNHSQIAEFKKIAQRYSSTALSLANSAAILAWPHTHYDWVRPGIMLYGVSPFAGKTGADHDLKPVMTLKSKLIAIKTIKAGESIGYGATWTCPETLPIGVVAIGYGDGYPRHAPSGTPVLINGIRCPMVGRVSMDMITVDLRNCSSATLGNPVTLWGDGLPIEIIAECAGTIGYELLCKVVMQRVRFRTSP